MKRQVSLEQLFARKTKKADRRLVPTFKGFTVFNTNADGNCLFAAIAHQLSLDSDAAPRPRFSASAADVRRTLVSYLRAHPSILSDCGKTPEGR